MSSVNLAKEMAVLSCEIARNCNKKETLFAASFNLTPAEFRCLRLFTNRPQLPIKSLTTELALTPGRITHLLTSLEAKKYITRSIDPTDKRNVIVKLTRKSKPLIEKLNTEHIRIHMEILESIPKSGQPTVIKAMKDVASALRDWNNKN